MRLQTSLTGLSRQTKRALVMVSDGTLFSFVLWAAFQLTSGSSASAPYNGAWIFPLAILIAIPIFARFALYKSIVRFMGTRMVFAVTKAVSLSVVVVVLVGEIIGIARASLETTIVFWTCALLSIGGVRFLAKTFLERQSLPQHRVAIYGAGQAGARLVVFLSSGHEFTPVAFVDDSIALHGSIVNGVEVHPPDRLLSLIDQLQITRVLLALPSVSRRERQRILVRLEALPVHVQTVPDILDLISGRAQVDDVSEVDVTDLLGRDAVPPNEALFDACVRDKSVMVTGAGGSIGSELCRQIVRLGPKRLVLFEQSEFALYMIEKELSARSARDAFDVEIIGLLGSILHRRRVCEILQTYRVDTLYHTAAYKHVPMVEQNIIEGINNNIFGTWHTAEAAIKAKVDTFVLISTDKAVGPTNVMGATKRFAELVLQALQDRGCVTQFCMVRFGNVLDSSGSVVPLFREQIRSGGPVTVTHPEATRYFMTIPEAAELVIHAGSMAKGGEIFLLDMGKPVRIQNLALSMIHLMGLTARDESTPEGDIEVRYTGLRPAEKVHEELLIGNNVTATEHPMIMRVEEEFLPWNCVQGHLEALMRAMRRFNCEQARELLLNSVNGYRASGTIDDLVWRRRAEDSTVIARSSASTSNPTAKRREPI